MIPIDFHSSRLKTKVKGHSSYIEEGGGGGISVLQTSSFIDNIFWNIVTLKYFY